MAQPRLPTFYPTRPLRHRASQLDEGYAGEETRSLSPADSDVMMMMTTTTTTTMRASPAASSPCPGDSGLLPPAQTALAHVLALPADQRRLLLQQALRSLSSRDKEDMGQFCYALAHFDPVVYLPAELVLGILAYLSPQELLGCTRVSRAWRAKSRDERLWRRLFRREGWVVDEEKLRAVEAREETERRLARDGGGGGGGGPAEGDARAGKKRKTEEAFSGSDGEGGALGAGIPLAAPWSVVGNVSEGSEDGVMDGIEGGYDRFSALDRLRDDDNHDDHHDDHHHNHHDDNHHNNYNPPSSASSSGEYVSPYHAASEQPLQIVPPLFRPDVPEARVSWAYLYRQRTRLEKNWAQGKFVNFQLPHPQHPEEGHTECVYAIQHTADHLVSGSRDKTLRIWNLDTGRLKLPPLHGHAASVLCLQFDERPDHDLIVSGGSDNWIIVWRFSTGALLKKLAHAHQESVLNLRFDDRYLVTCSKDRSIKVFNRDTLSPTSALIPSASPVLGLPPPDRAPLPPFTCLLTFGPGHTLQPHQAAVNAVQIHGNTIISASGDRSIKAWDIDRGRFVRTYAGHTKGIACVQFDGRRIVSGSSDNTVRIFDAETGAEVACLSHHHNLVRTLQARFGDLDTVTDADLLAESQACDRAFFLAHPTAAGRMAGVQPHATTASAPRPRNAGSRDPRLMQAIGAKIPPGGGGGRWARVVSGSYDETVIVWRKDVSSGAWVKGWVGGMEGALRACGPQGTGGRARQGAGGVGGLQAAVQAQQQQALQQLQQQPQPQPPPPAAPALHPQQQQHPQPPPQQQQHAPPANTVAGPAPPPHHHHHHHHNHVPHAHAPHAPVPRETARVFKLQFDARRLIACSQNPVIVGWDFAAGERELERVGGWMKETS